VNRAASKQPLLPARKLKRDKAASTSKGKAISTTAQVNRAREPEFSRCGNKRIMKKKMDWKPLPSVTEEKHMSTSRKVHPDKANNFPKGKGPKLLDDLTTLLEEKVECESLTDDGTGCDSVKSRFYETIVGKYCVLSNSGKVEVVPNEYNRKPWFNCMNVTGERSDQSIRKDKNEEIGEIPKQIKKSRNNKNAKKGKARNDKEKKSKKIKREQEKGKKSTWQTLNRHQIAFCLLD